MITWLNFDRSTFPANVRFHSTNEGLIEVHAEALFSVIRNILCFLTPGWVSFTFEYLRAFQGHQQHFTRLQQSSHTARVSFLKLNFHSREHISATSPQRPDVRTSVIQVYISLQYTPYDAASVCFFLFFIAFNFSIELLLIICKHTPCSIAHMIEEICVISLLQRGVVVQLCVFFLLAPSHSHIGTRLLTTELLTVCLVLAHVRGELLSHDSPEEKVCGFVCGHVLLEEQQNAKLWSYL